MLQKNSLWKRKLESSIVQIHFPDFIPIILQKYHLSKLPELKENRFLFPCSFKISQIMYSIQKRIQKQDKLKFFIHQRQVSYSDDLQELYENEKDEDGLLYIYYCGESEISKKREKLIHIPSYI